MGPMRFLRIPIKNEPGVNRVPGASVEPMGPPASPPSRVDVLLPIYAALADAWGHLPEPQLPAEIAAWDLVYAGLAHLCGPNRPGMVTDFLRDGVEVSADTIERAWGALVGGPKEAEMRERFVDRYIERAQTDGAWTTYAGYIARVLGQPAGIVPELEKRMRSHYEPWKQGRVPVGKHTTKQILAWLFPPRRPAKKQEIKKRR